MIRHVTKDVTVVGWDVMWVITVSTIVLVLSRLLPRRTR